jgi:hypothetical protein
MSNWDQLETPEVGENTIISAVAALGGEALATEEANDIYRNLTSDDMAAASNVIDFDLTDDGDTVENPGSSATEEEEGEGDDEAAAAENPGTESSKDSDTAESARRALENAPKFEKVSPENPGSASRDDGTSSGNIERDRGSLDNAPKPGEKPVEKIVPDSVEDFGTANDNDPAERTRLNMQHGDNPVKKPVQKPEDGTTAELARRTLENVLKPAEKLAENLGSASSDTIELARRAIREALKPRQKEAENPSSGAKPRQK